MSDISFQMMKVGFKLDSSFSEVCEERLGKELDDNMVSSSGQHHSLLSFLLTCYAGGISGLYKSDAGGPVSAGG